MRNVLCTLVLLSSTLLAVPTHAGDKRAKPFELWPADNQSAPAPYVKVAPVKAAKPQAWPYKGGESVEVTVDAAKTLAPVTPFHFGGNVAWWNHKDWLLRADIVEKARQSGIRFWRWPGGSSSDAYHWDGNYSGFEKQSDGGDASRMNQAWAVSNDDFVDFCRQTGSEAIVTANYGLARRGSVAKASDLAARWVKYFQKMKFKVRYWEIGNENYGNWEEGTKLEGQPLLSGEQYGKDWVTIAKALRKADPDIYVGAVAVDQDNNEEWTGFRGWMKGLLPQVQTQADYLILHQYFMWPFDQQNNYTNPTPETLFGNLYKLGEAIQAVRVMEPKYTKGASPLPVALTEFNLVNASPKETIELLNGLFTAEVLGDHIKSGYVASNHWDWRNGLDKKLGGDHALLSNDDPGVPDGTPRPAYYAYVLYKNAFGDRLVESSSSDPKVKVYASRFQGGETGLVLVNETDKARRVNIKVSGAAPTGVYQAWVMTGDGVHAKQVSFNGVEGPENGGGPFPVDSLAPYGGTVDTAKGIQLTVPPVSASGIVLY